MTNRLLKVQDLLHKEIALLLIKDIQNPLIKSVTISGVKVSKDLRYSEIFFTSLSEDNAKIEIELNKPWWRKQSWKIIITPGLFTHKRLSDRGY